MRYEVVTAAIFMEPEKRNIIDDPDVLHIKIGLGDGNYIAIDVDEADGELLITADGAVQIEPVACNRIAVKVKP